jgi:hypothetical protein
MNLLEIVPSLPIPALALLRFKDLQQSHQLITLYSLQDKPTWGSSLPLTIWQDTKIVM